jgi:hypothetical protein
MSRGSRCWLEDVPFPNTTCCGDCTQVDTPFCINLSSAEAGRVSGMITACGFPGGPCRLRAALVIEATRIECCCIPYLSV